MDESENCKKYPENIVEEFFEHTNKKEISIRVQERRRLYEKERFLVEHLGEERFLSVTGEIINVLKENNIMESPAYTKDVLDHVADVIIYQFMVFK